MCLNIRKAINCPLVVYLVISFYIYGQHLRSKASWQ